VQALRQRAQAAGHLSSNGQYVVYPQGEAIAVYPRTHYVYVNYYDPYVVYGPWWWPYYRPVFWRPWAPRPVFVAHGFFYTKPDWHHRHVQIVHKPVHVQHHNVVPGRWHPHKHVVVKPYVRVPEAQRKPIVSPVCPPRRLAPKSGSVRRSISRSPRCEPAAAEARSHTPMVQRQWQSAAR
jgi:hypothetical protein